MAGNGRRPVGVPQAQGMLGTPDCGRRRLCRRSECARCSVSPQQRKEDIVLRKLRRRPGAGSAPGPPLPSESPSNARLEKDNRGKCFRVFGWLMNTGPTGREHSKSVVHLLSTFTPRQTQLEGEEGLEGISGSTSVCVLHRCAGRLYGDADGNSQHVLV
ncbi:hypothetical protein Baya_6007 [Bagarius yarrelli]|uniref:Uncharacterized protein n=1 Tax=Bagarius yarrelli TaxID=175774 RepID=A0A556U0T2_BAGYA|nr:hypothetical protein Baya_6007 [Bagarius yarrelli]